MFSLDKVSKIENGEETNLGEFIEIRSTNKNQNKDQFQNVINKLGLKSEEGIKQSYFEM